MVSENIIRKRLSKLEESLRRLESKKGISREKFMKNWEIQDVILREFEVAIESCVDIGTHIISEKGWKSPDKYSDVPDILAENDVIPEYYKETLRKIIAFRNIIVHEYLYIDLKKVYANLKKLNDLRKFAKFIENFLQKEKKIKEIVIKE